MKTLDQRIHDLKFNFNLKEYEAILLEIAEAPAAVRDIYDPYVKELNRFINRRYFTAIRKKFLLRVTSAIEDHTLITSLNDVPENVVIDDKLATAVYTIWMEYLSSLNMTEEQYTTTFARFKNPVLQSNDVLQADRFTTFYV